MPRFRVPQLLLLVRYSPCGSVSSFRTRREFQNRQLVLRFVASREKSYLSISRCVTFAE